MKLFLSYPSPERQLAERLALALEAEGHSVFFDRSDLASGQAFHQRLRDAIAAADAMVFLVTPASVAPGSYALAELDIARERWRRPSGHVLPVLVAPTPLAALPPYLAAVTVLQPQGDTVAETVAALARLRGGGGRGRRVAVALLAAALLAAGGIYTARQLAQRRAAAAALQADTSAAAQALALCSDGNHALALQQLDALVRHQPPAAAATTAREDCAMRWMREMHAFSSGSARRTFDEQVAVVAPVLLQGLLTAHGQRAADLRAHLGWGERLRWREGTGTTDPVPNWQRALVDDPANVYAHAMWGWWLVPAHLADASRHFDQAVASGRERAYVRVLQLGATLGTTDEAAAYAITVANAMRRGGESVTPEQRDRLWSRGYAELRHAAVRDALFAALPPGQALATYDWLFGGAVPAQQQGAEGRYVRALLQSRAGDRDAARAALQALLQEEPRALYRVGNEIRRELAAIDGR